LIEDYGETINFEMDGLEINQQHFVHAGQLFANYYLDVAELEVVDNTNGKNLTGFKFRSAKSILP